MRQLLIVTHCPSDNTQKLRDALLEGVSHPDIAELQYASKAPTEASAKDVLAADGIIIGTTENFGYMAGLIKDFFERIYYPCLEEKQGLPIALYIRAGNDGRGTQESIDRITTGLRWRYITEPLICRGDFDECFMAQCKELGTLMAAGLEAGIY